MERRELLKILALTFVSPRLNGQQAPAVHLMEAATKTSEPPEYKLQFFSEEEIRILDQLMEMIIPSDSHSPGAHVAKASRFADLMVATSDDAVKNQWRDGMRLVQEEALGSSLAETLQKAADNEGNPKTDLQRFFGLLKEMTVNGYYTSATGIHLDLQYLGNTYVGAFPGCTHSEHEG